VHVDKDLKDILDDLPKLQLLDKEIILLMKNNSNQIVIENELIYRRGKDQKLRIIVPNVLQIRLIAFYHRFFGHIGISGLI